MACSLYLSAHDGDSKSVPTACRAFEQWLKEHGYQLAVNCAPWDSREFGGFLGAEDAADLVFDFLGDQPNQQGHLDALLAHAGELGQVSNQWN